MQEVALNQHQQYLEMAQTFRASGRLEEAATQLVLARVHAPENLECALCYADVLDSLNQREAALNELLLLWHSYSRDANLNYRLALLCASLHRVESAIWFYERTLEVNAIHQEALYEYSELLLRQGRDREALVILERLKLLDKDNTDVLVKIARAWKGMKDSAKAIEHLKLAYRMEPARLDLRIQLAEVYVEEGLYPQAVKLMLPLEEGDSVSSEKLALIVKCYIGMGQYDQAHQTLTRYEVLFPRDPEVFRIRAQMAIRLNQRDEAESALLKVLELQKTMQNVEALIHLYEEDSPEKLEQFLIEMLDRFPREPEICYQLALLYKSDSPAEAMDFIEKALGMNENQSRYYLLKGELLVKLNKYARAMEWFDSMRKRFVKENFEIQVEKLIEQDRRYKETIGLLNRAEEALESNSYKKALQCYREIVERIPDNPDWLEQLGNLYSFEVSYPEAMDCFARAREFCKPADKGRLLEKAFYLAYLHNDFERAHELATPLILEKEDEAQIHLQLIKVERHLLTERVFPTKYFQDRMASYQDKSGSGKGLAILLNGYSYLWLGSHLLDSTVWANSASQAFVRILEEPGFEKWYSLAFKGLYQAFLMDRNYERLLPVLEDWNRRSPDSVSRNLLILELKAQSRYREAVRYVSKFLEDFPEDLFLRFLLVELSYLEFDGASRSRQTKTLVARFQEKCQRVQDWSSYFDYAMALLLSTEDKPQEDTYQKILQSMKKSLRLSESTPAFQIMMLKVMEYGSKLNEQEQKLAYSKKRIFLEKELNHWPDSALLLLEYGKHLLNDKSDENLGCRYLLKALTLDPSQDEANVLLADVYFRQGHKKKAYHYYLKLTESALERSTWEKLVENMQRML
ncbi:MAG: tetratricopeptide repeat protein [Candidatus Cloacimonetes bacterium]|nr:tetratricopeptide repeat protein [Candidatus Cloacimonadota bacterium]